MLEASSSFTDPTNQISLVDLIVLDLPDSDYILGFAESFGGPLQVKRATSNGFCEEPSPVDDPVTIVDSSAATVDGTTTYRFVRKLDSGVRQPIPRSLTRACGEGAWTRGERDNIGEKGGAIRERDGTSGSSGQRAAVSL
jgi:hypothetical protein